MPNESILDRDPNPHVGSEPLVTSGAHRRGVVGTVPIDSTHATAPPTLVDPATSGEAGDGRRRLRRRGGIAGLAASAAYLASGLLTTVTGGVEPPENVADMDRYVADVTDASLGFVLYAIAGIALCALYVPMSRAVIELLGRRRTARAGTASVIAGLIALVPAYLISAVASVGLVDRHEAGADPEVLFDAYEVLSTVAEASFGLGSILSLGVGPLLWGLAARSGREIPRWLTGLSIVVGVSGFVWAAPPSVRPMLVVMLNVLGSLVLFVGLSRRLLRSA